MHTLRLSNNDYRDESRLNETPTERGPDYDHFIHVLNDGFNQLISTFHPNVGPSFVKIKEGYEELINSIVENLTSQIEYLSNEVD
jgi:hypothetical protein